MKLRMLRKHYKKNAKGNTWVPKLAYNSIEEIKEKTGYDPNITVIYDDCFCGKLHIATHALKEKTKR